MSYVQGHEAEQEGRYPIVYRFDMSVADSMLGARPSRSRTAM
jgi:hypothetical protein